MADAFLTHIPGLLRLDHTDRFEQNPLLDRLGLEVVAFSQVKLFPRLGGQGELKKRPELEQCRLLFPPYVSDYNINILLMRANLPRNFSPRRCFGLHAYRPQECRVPPLLHAYAAWAHRRPRSAGGPPL